MITSIYLYYIPCPLQARTLLGTLEAEGKRAASPLADQIKLIEHCSALVHDRVSKLARPDLQTHLHGISSGGLSLPFDIRCQLIVRRASDLVDDILASKKKEEVHRCLKQLNSVVCFWLAPDSNCDDSKIESKNVWGSMADSVQASVVRGLKSQVEGHEEVELAAKVWQNVKGCKRLSREE